MTFESFSQSYKRQIQEIENEMDNCIKSNTSKFENFLIILYPKFISRIFKVVITKTFGFKKHIKIYKKNKLIYGKRH